MVGIQDNVKDAIRLAISSEVVVGGVVNPYLVKCIFRDEGLQKTKSG